MSDIGRVLKDEIRRLARSELRKEVTQLRRVSGQYRKDIAQLKRELDGARKRIAVLESELERRREQAVKSAEVDGRRFSPRGVASHRQKLGLSAADYGKLLGVSGQTIYLWEQGKTRPNKKAFARLVELRGLGKRAALRRLEKTDNSAN